MDKKNKQLADSKKRAIDGWESLDGRLTSINCSKYFYWKFTSSPLCLWKYVLPCLWTVIDGGSTEMVMSLLTIWRQMPCSPSKPWCIHSFKYSHTPWLYPWCHGQNHGVFTLLNTRILHDYILDVMLWSPFFRSCIQCMIAQIRRDFRASYNNVSIQVLS